MVRAVLVEESGSRTGGIVTGLAVIMSDCDSELKGVPTVQASQAQPRSSLS